MFANIFLVLSVAVLLVAERATGCQLYGIIALLLNFYVMFKGLSWFVQKFVNWKGGWLCVV